MVKPGGQNLLHKQSIRSVLSPALYKTPDMNKSCTCRGMIMVTSTTGLA